MATAPVPDSAAAAAVDLLRDLIRVDTSNPPGDEAPAAQLLAQQLKATGVPYEWIEPRPGRANLVARLPGDGSQKPLLLSSHLDVVPANAGDWSYPPFDAVEADGAIWGRGAIDMKGFAAMAFAVFKLAKAENWPLKRDLIFAAVADEEAGCQWGSRYLADHHPDLVRAEYAVNEVGGFCIHRHGRRIYLVQRAERGVAWLRLRLHGTPGHSSRPCPGSALSEAARVVDRLSRAHFPHHVSPESTDFLEAMAAISSPVEAAVLRGLKKPRTGRWLLRHLVPAGEQRTNLHPVLANTATPTILHGGTKVNVLPSEALVEIDGRTVPGSSTAELIEEIRNLIGPRGDLEILLDEPPATFPVETPFFDAIRRVIDRHDPGAPVVPYVIPGFTDSRHWSRLGTICYGFYPLKLPADLDFASLFHGTDERIPIDAFRFGLNALRDLVWSMAVEG